MKEHHAEVARELHVHLDDARTFGEAAGDGGHRVLDRPVGIGAVLAKAAVRDGERACFEAEQEIGGGPGLAFPLCEADARKEKEE